jgi:hypothetical protein
VHYTKGDPTVFHAVFEAVVSSEEKAAMTPQLGSCHDFYFEAMQ